MKVSGLACNKKAYVPMFMESGYHCVNGVSWRSYNTPYVLRWDRLRIEVDILHMALSFKFIIHLRSTRVIGMSF